MNKTINPVNFNREYLLIGIISVCLVMLLFSTGYGHIYESKGSGNGNGSQPPIAFNRLDSLSAKLHVILAIQDFNGDGTRDTLKAEFLQENLRTTPYRARLIAWGCQRDSSGKLTGTAQFTEIIYPKYYINMRTPVSIQRYNQDTLQDIVFTIRGKVKRGHDTIDALRMLAVFGQPQLYEQSALLLEDIKNDQKKPYQAIVLKENNQLKHKGKRDLSGTYSWEMPRINLNTQDTTSQEQKGGRQSLATIDFRVFPNPAVYTTNITAAKVPAGVYRVRIVATNGVEINTMNVTLMQEEDILSSLDVSQLATGFYMILVSRDDLFLGSFPIIITH